MLELKNITMYHAKDLRKIIENFSFSLKENDKIAIIGEEGNGKSSLLKLIYQPSLVESYIEYEGNIIRHGERIGYLPQELDQTSAFMTVYEYLCEKEGFLESTPKEIALLAQTMGLLEEQLYSPQAMQSLSGGEKIKIQLIGILLQKPTVLLLDEPSNDLDIETLQWLEKFIRKETLPILYISHDEVLLENTANGIIHLESTKRRTTPVHTIVRVGYKEYLKRRENLIQHQTQIARKERSDYEKQQERFRQIYQKVEYQQATITRQDAHGGYLLKKKMKALKSQEKRFEKEYATMSEVPDVEEAILVRFDDSIHVPSGKVVLDYHLDKLMIEERELAKNIHLNIVGPKHVCIVGKNGVGKTTLLKQIAHELLEREDLTVAYMPQYYDELWNVNLTPIEFLTLNGTKEEHTKICTYLGSMKYTADEMQHSIQELSGGQRAKLAFLKMNLMKCNVLLLDEPNRNFSPLSAPVIRSVLKKFKGTIISVSHDRKYINEVCDVVYELSKEGLIERTLF